MNNTWTVDPSETWKLSNQDWLLEANLPGTERCQETLTGQRCELKVGHSSSHMIHVNSKADGPETTPAD